MIFFSFEIISVTALLNNTMAPHPESKIKATLGLKIRLGIASGLCFAPESVTSSDRHPRHQAHVTELHGLLKPSSLRWQLLSLGKFSLVWLTSYSLNKNTSILLCKGRWMAWIIRGQLWSSAVAITMDVYRKLLGPFWWPSFLRITLSLSKKPNKMLLLISMKLRCHSLLNVTNLRNKKKKTPF